MITTAMTMHHHHDDHDHEHDSSITSLSLTSDKPVDVTKFEDWMSELRATKGPDLLRYKGILDVAGSNQRLAIQGVHMMMEGSNLSPWKDGAKRQSRMVFIGRKLDEKALREGFGVARGLTHDNARPPPSIANGISSVPVTALAVNRNGDAVAAALGDGSLRFLAGQCRGRATAKELKLHNGVSLSLQPDADDHAFLSGGDDGKIFIIDPAADAPTLLAEHKNQWIDHVASSAEGGFAPIAPARISICWMPKARRRASRSPHPSSIGGVAFSPNGKRLAASHYNGVSLWWTNSKEQTPVKLSWKGSHLGLIWHPDGKIIISAMQDGALHGWRLSDMNEMRMEGYAGKIHSMSFTAKGRYLASSGAEQIICWPFFGGGPWGKTPLTLGGRDGRLVTRVAPHPKDELVAAGYEDGMIILAPLDGRMEMMIHPPVAEKGAGVVGMVWNAAGDCLFAALENGYLMLFTIESVEKVGGACLKRRHERNLLAKLVSFRHHLVEIQPRLHRFHPRLSGWLQNQKRNRRQ